MRWLRRRRRKPKWGGSGRHTTTYVYRYIHHSLSQHQRFYQSVPWRPYDIPSISASQEFHPKRLSHILHSHLQRVRLVSHSFLIQRSNYLKQILTHSSTKSACHGDAQLVLEEIQAPFSRDRITVSIPRCQLDTRIKHFFCTFFLENILPAAVKCAGGHCPTTS